MVVLQPWFSGLVPPAPTPLGVHFWGSVMSAPGILQCTGQPLQNKELVDIKRQCRVKNTFKTRLVSWVVTYLVFHTFLPLGRKYSFQCPGKVTCFGFTSLWQAGGWELR